MRWNIILDFGLNVVLPLVLGSLLYLGISIPYDWVQNHLADGLWAYAFINAMLLVRNRKVDWFWTMLVFVTALVYELLQYSGHFEGTADIIDLAVYIVFFITGLLLNNFYKQSFAHQTTATHA